MWHKQNEKVHISPIFSASGVCFGVCFVLLPCDNSETGSTWRESLISSLLKDDWHCTYSIPRSSWVAWRLNFIHSILWNFIRHITNDVDAASDTIKKVAGWDQVSGGLFGQQLQLWNTLLLSMGETTVVWNRERQRAWKYCDAQSLAWKGRVSGQIPK